MTRHERLLENYEDAYFALLMEDVSDRAAGTPVIVTALLPIIASSCNSACVVVWMDTCKS